MLLRNILQSWSLINVLPKAIAQGQAEWDALNATVNGRLHVNTPLALPCFSSYNGKPVDRDDEACAAIRGGYIMSHFRADHASGYYYSQGEICLSDPSGQCVLDSSVNPAGLPAAGASCEQGSVPSYYIDVQESSDIMAAFKFSNATGVPLAIKNSGHDFNTRSSQKGALMLWVFNLKEMAYHDGFLPEGCVCASSTGRAMTVATGVRYSPEVAVSGGWVLGGGHSVLLPVYGLGVDRVVEFKIVSGDGVLRVANQCQYPDLFWALKGGGGGTFGVVLEATYRVEPIILIAVAYITFPANTSVDTSLEWIELVARESLKWGRLGWGGHALGLSITHMNPLPGIANLDDGGAMAQKSVQAATDFALSVGGASVVEVLPDFLSVWDKYIVTDTGGASTQIPMFRLIPQALFSGEEGVGRIIDYIRAVQELGFDPRTMYAPVDTPFVAENSSRIQGSNTTGPNTSVHPAWYTSLWSLTGGVILPWNTTYDVRLQNITAVAKSGWGPNYERLLEIKKQYDPAGLLKCWKCVGFEDQDIESDRYRCNGKLQQDINSMLQCNLSSPAG
ncbi:FAD-binding domain-containing protein [Xylariaceae sp. FL0662B]|nr:FAD-binding domain-containing protein [Xylariaceae sp. FL0662B]